jgi:hypothetical protein
MRYFTRQNFVAILILSLGIYYAFVWACNWLSASWTYATIIEMHQSPYYYLTIGMCVAVCFMADLFIRSYEFNFQTSPADHLRALV